MASPRITLLASHWAGVQMNILIEWLLADAFVNRVGEMKQAEENALTRI